MPNLNSNKYINNPYPGIRSFTVNESNLFFGREEQVKDLSKLLIKNHFAAVSGASGSGKSSVVKAGVIPWFLNKYSNSDYIVFRPGNNPIKNLTKSLNNLFQKSGYERRSIKKQTSLLNKNENAFSEIFSKLNYDKKLLIYIDQFEEIFRYFSNEKYSKSEEFSEIFIKNLINVVKNPDLNVFIIFSLRSDFLSECAIFQGLPELINKGHYLLPAMTIKQKEQAIKKPAEIAGAMFSPKLVEVIEKDISNINISLPVLQHALMRTWENWLLEAPPNAPLDIKHYKAIGTVNKALSFHAEDIYNSLNDEQKKLTEKIFRALTFWGDDERGTRNPQKLGDLCEITGAREMELITIIDKFRAEGNSFLQPNESVKLDRNSVIDISHESIMIVWERLTEWVEKEAQSAQLYLRLSKSAELYQAGKTGILVNPDLQIALNWLKNDKPNAAWALRYDPAFDRVVNYVFYSKGEFEKSVKAEQAKKERALKRTRFVAIILGAASVVAVLLMIIALNLRFKAEQSKKEAVAKQKLAVKQSNIAEKRRKEAVALQLISKQQQEIAEQNRIIAEQQKRYAVAQQKEALFQKQQAIMAKNEAISARDLARKLQNEAERLRDEAIEQKLLVEKQKKRAELSEAKTDTLRRLAVSKTLAVKAYKMFFDNQKAEHLSQEQKNLPSVLALQAYYFNNKNKGNPLDPDIFTALLVISGKTHNMQKLHDDAVRDICYIPSSDYFVSVGSDGRLFYNHLINSEDYMQINAANNIGSDFRCADVSKNGKYLIAANKEGSILFWKIDDLMNKPIAKKHGNNLIEQIKFISNNSFIAADNSGKIALYSINDITFVKEKETDIAAKLEDFDIFNNQIFIATRNGKVYTYSLEMKKINTFSSDYGKISSLTISEGGYIYIGHTNGLVEKVDKKGNEIKRWFAHNSGITEILISSKTNKIITCGYDKNIKIWDSKDLTIEPVKINIHNNWIYAIELTQNEKHLISADASGEVKTTLVDIEDLKNAVKQNVNKNMSKNNWNKYVGSDIKYNADLPKDL